eukprot:TRINITY_DN8546_c0_g1_i1.p1 TRINITY_DN8546_c0_g1~~TRINITY_DN8546_c0_g1_i1.p1  ORF type:complete len:221 (-),score=57.80 TRINITY_DN8546_c0_g1_i1:71-733(-)
MEAARAMKPYHVDLLVRQGADVSAISGRLHEHTDAQGNIVLHHILACDGMASTLTAVLGASQVDPNIANSSKQTLLHVAAANDMEDYVTLLLSQPGIQKELRDSEDRTPLQVALDSFSVRSLFAFIKGGAKMSVSDLESRVDADGNGLLHKAVSTSSVDLLQLLLELGMNPNAASKETDVFSDAGTPLHHGNFLIRFWLINSSRSNGSSASARRSIELWR